MAVPIIRPGFGTDLMPREISEFIFQKAYNQSAVQQVATSTPLPNTGKAIPVVTGKPSAGWVSEAGRKPVSDATIGTKLMDPKKLAVVVPFSKEYLRDSRIDLLAMLRPMIAEAFATSFDSAAIKGTSTPFSGFINQTTNAVEIGSTTQANGGFYGDLVKGLGTVVDEGKNYRVSDFLVDDTAEGLILGATDTTGRPLFIPGGVTGNAQSFEGPIGSMLGRRTYYSPMVATPIVAGTPPTGGIKMIGGDFSQAVYGIAEDIAYDLSDQASIVLADGTTTLHLWQNNLVALLAEAEFGFLVNDVQAFVKYTDAIA
jgi:HK97 family phage major capsid protein